MPVAPHGSSQAPAGGAHPGASPEKEIEERLAAIAKALEGERDSLRSFREKVDRLESRMKFLQNLSEVISQRYNPFLGTPDAESRLGAAIPFPPEGDDALGGPTGASLEDEGDVLAAVGRVHAPAASSPPRSRHAGEMPLLADVRSCGPKEHYACLAWFDLLLESTQEPQCLHRFIDYYRDAGWISPEIHEWMGRLAAGLVPRKSETKAEGLEPRKLIQLHLATLRFLDSLAGNKLQEPEIVQLEHSLHRFGERGERTWG